MGRAFGSGRADPTANSWTVPLRPRRVVADNYIWPRSASHVFAVIGRIVLRAIREDNQRKP